jgi:hypothetical protein
MKRVGFGIDGTRAKTGRSKGAARERKTGKEREVEVTNSFFSVATLFKIKKQCVQKVWVPLLKLRTVFMQVASRMGTYSTIAGNSN